MGKIIVYADGAVKNNNESMQSEEKRRYCGWACSITDEGRSDRVIQSGDDWGKTNNQMELLAVIYAMRAIEDKTAQVKIYTDSKYVADNYIHAFQMRSNQLYWKMFEEEKSKFSDIAIEWKSRENPEIEEVDRLAQKEAGKIQNILENTKK